MAHATLIIRADASPHIGTGHLMRMLALAQAWQERGNTAIFVVAMDPGLLAERLHLEGFDIVRLVAAPGSLNDAAQTAVLAQAHGARWIVFDGYHFDTLYQQTLGGYGIPLLCVDDAGYAGEFVADIILNQNLLANEELYKKRPKKSRLVLGPRFALLRREFWGWRGWVRDVPDVARKILLTLGGSDPDNVTLGMLRSIGGIGLADANVRVIIGASNPHADSVCKEASRLGGCCEIIVNTNEMPDHIAWADVTVAAGGSTCWELAMMGMPMVLVILADNQQGLSEALAASGVAINLGWHNTIQQDSVARTLEALLHDPQRRQAMSDCGRELVDGHGATRVAEFLI